MNRLQVAAAVAAVSLSAQAVLAQNLLTNGNLDMTYQQQIVDNDPPGEGPEDFFLPKPSSWVNVGTRTISGAFEDESSSEPWAGPAPTPVTTDSSDGGDRGVFFKAFTGNEANGPVTGHLYQDVPATPGLKYVLTGWAGGEPNLLVAGAEFAVEFLNGGGGVIGGATLDLKPTLLVDNTLPFDYKQYMVMATAPAGAVSARARASMIGGTPNPAGGGQAFVVDDFVLTAVPEPASAAMAALGLAACSVVRRRSRR